MPRYFFHVTDGTYSPDLIGTELSDVFAAEAEAVRACGGMLRDIGARFWNGAEWTMEVKDEAQRPLFTLRLWGEQHES